MKKSMTYRIKGAKWISATITFVITLVYLNVRDITNFMYDASYYWATADSCFDGKFDILKFPETFRGYLLPVWLSFIKHMGEHMFIRGGGYQLYRLSIAVLLSAFLSVILPNLFRLQITSIADIIRQMILLVVVLFYWGDFFCSPLSDFAALFFATGSIVLIESLIKKKRGIMSVLWAVAAGMMLYAAYNIRVAYLYVIVVYLVYLIVRLIRKRAFRVELLLGMLLGGAIVAAPQSMINHQYVGSYSPKVYTEQLYGYSSDLQKVQVLWGLSYPNYETYVGSAEEYPEASVYFIDKVGEEIIAREGIIAENFSYAVLFKLFLKYPMDMMSIYMRHFISLMTPKFTETYITNIYPGKGGMVALILVIWFTALLNLVVNIQNKRCNWYTLVLALIVSVSALLQMAGAPELRFFMSIHMLGYFYVVCYVDYCELGRVIRQYAFPIVIAFVLFCLLWVGVLSSVLSSNQNKTLLINDENIYRIEQSQ